MARRIPGNDQLNAVDCLLPKFDKEAVEAVATAIMTGGDSEGDTPLKRVLIQPVELFPNPAMPEALWDKFVTLPFLFFSVDASGAVVADIVDPHGDFLADGAAKLRGLADYAEKHGTNFGRIEAVAELDGSVLALDLKAQNVRDMVRSVATSREAYRTQWSTPYG